ncbi:MAG: ATP-binding protein, partial [Chitinophagales bacterium]
MGISGMLTKIFSYVVKPTEDLYGTQIDLLIDRIDHAIHICEVKFSANPFILDKKTAQNIQQKHTVFQYHNQSK